MQAIRKEIQDFIIVNKYGNFTRAADQLGVKQSGLSKSIMRLEQELKTKLFMRGARELKLTDAGLIYLEEIKKIMAIWELAEQRAQQLTTEIHGQFTIGSHAVIAKYILPKIYQNISKQAAIDLQTVLISSKEAVESVREMKLDMAIAVKPIHYPELVIIPLWKEYIGLYSYDGEMKEHILYNEEMINSHEFLGMFANKKSSAINDYQVLYSISKRNKHTMCFLPNPIADNEGKLKLIKKMTKPIDVCLVYRADRLKTKGFEFLLSSIKKCL